MVFTVPGTSLDLSALKPSMATNHFFPWLCDDHIEMIIHDHLMIIMTDDHTKMTTYLPKKNI